MRNCAPIIAGNAAAHDAALPARAMRQAAPAFGKTPTHTTPTKTKKA
jgi:hypothetical protein